MSEGSAGMRLFGGILMGIGILIALLSGLCSLWFLADGGNDAGWWEIVLLVGGIPFALGVLLIATGYFVHRKGRA